jgi:hypothetical protein
VTLQPIHLALATFIVGLTLDQCSPGLPAHAQAPDVGLMLARVFVSESGFDGAADHLPIANYTRSLARYWRVPMGVALPRRYTRALAPESERRSRPWLANLMRNGAEPRSWPHGPNSQPWPERRQQWLDTLARADAFLAGEVDAPPGCRPHSWGSPEYDREAIESTIANGGFVIDCGPTKNVFLRWHP